MKLKPSVRQRTLSFRQVTDYRMGKHFLQLPICRGKIIKTHNEHKNLPIKKTNSSSIKKGASKVNRKLSKEKTQFVKKQPGHTGEDLVFVWDDMTDSEIPSWRPLPSLASRGGME